MHLKRQLSAFAAVSAFLSPCRAAYSLKDDYTADNFFEKFTFFTDDDPTHGYVDYISQSAASSAGLINTNNNQVYMGVDSENVASGRGRKSVRITSNAVYNHALIILDLEHMPASTCGTWPAFWTVGPNWPTSGEIDIIEGVNTQSSNSVALHTGPGCSISGGGGSSDTSPNSGGTDSAQAIFSGNVQTSNCDIAASGQATNAGCAITSSDSSTYGSGLNSANGGVYATEWNSDVIRVWFFPRGSIPSDIDSGSPSPGSWGAPMAAFGSASCDIDSAFKDQQIVFDTTFCGDWAGQVWSSDSTCSAKASTCEEYVQNNPEAFADSYWAVNSLKVFTGEDDGSGAAPSVSQSASSSAATGKPTVSAPTASSISESVSSASASASGKPRPNPTASSLPSVPASPVPTTMSTSARASSEGSSPGQHTRTRAWTWGGYQSNDNWKHPARMDKRMDRIGARTAEPSLPSPGRSMPTSAPEDEHARGNEPEHGREHDHEHAFPSERPGSPETASPSRTLVRPVVRRGLNGGGPGEARAGNMDVGVAPVNGEAIGDDRAHTHDQDQGNRSGGGSRGRSGSTSASAGAAQRTAASHEHQHIRRHLGRHKERRHFGWGR